MIVRGMTVRGGHYSLDMWVCFIYMNLGIETHGMFQKCHCHGRFTRLTLDSFYFILLSPTLPTLIDLILLSYLTHHFTIVILHSLSFFQDTDSFYDIT